MASAWHILLSLMWVFIVTFVVFPGAFFDSHFNFMDNSSNEFTWYSLSIILTFNVMDTVGRKLGGLVKVPTPIVHALSLARSLFIVTTILIALSDKDEDKTIENDGLKIANMVLFAVTNGFTSTLCAIKAPEYVDDDQKEQVGIFVGLFIALGIVIGSLIAVPVGNVLPVNWS